MTAEPFRDVSTSRAAASESILLLHAEELVVGRRRIDGETVRVTTTTGTREQLVDERLTQERVEIERVPVGRIVDTLPPVRQEGDVTVVSVVEEILVLERRLLLKEEVRLRRVEVMAVHREVVSLREETATVSRSAPRQARETFSPST